MKTKHKHPLAHCVSVSGRTRRKRRPRFHLGVIVEVGLVVGAYFILKAILPTVAELLDGIFAHIVEKVGKGMTDED